MTEFIEIPGEAVGCVEYFVNVSNVNDFGIETDGINGDRYCISINRWAKPVYLDEETYNKVKSVLLNPLRKGCSCDHCG